jgi:hypothetical protein
MPRQLLAGVGRASDQEPVSPHRQLRETPPDGSCKASTIMPDAEDDEDENRG